MRKLILILVLVCLPGMVFAGEREGNGGNTFSVEIEHARDLAAEYLESMDPDVIRSGQGFAPRWEEFLKEKDSWAERMRNASVRAVYPSRGDAALYDEHTRRRVEALVQDGLVIYLDGDLLRSHQRRELAGILIHEVGHLSGFGFEHEADLNSYAASVVRHTNVVQCSVFKVTPASHAAVGSLSFPNRRSTSGPVLGYSSTTIPWGRKTVRFSAWISEPGVSPEIEIQMRGQGPEDSEVFEQSETYGGVRLQLLDRPVGVIFSAYDGNQLVYYSFECEKQ